MPTGVRRMCHQSPRLHWVFSRIYGCLEGTRALRLFSWGGTVQRQVRVS